jgi:hypothetical protein
VPVSLSIAGTTTEKEMSSITWQETYISVKAYLFFAMVGN